MRKGNSLGDDRFQGGKGLYFIQVEFKKEFYFNLLEIYSGGDNCIQLARFISNNHLIT